MTACSSPRGTSLIPRDVAVMDRSPHWPGIRPTVTYLGVYVGYLFLRPEGEISHWVSLVVLPTVGLWILGRRTEPTLRLTEVLDRVGLRCPARCSLSSIQLPSRRSSSSEGDCSDRSPSDSGHLLSECFWLPWHSRSVTFPTPIRIPRGRAPGIFRARSNWRLSTEWQGGSFWVECSSGPGRRCSRRFPFMPEPTGSPR